MLLNLNGHLINYCATFSFSRAFIGSDFDIRNFALVYVSIYLQTYRPLTDFSFRDFLTREIREVCDEGIKLPHLT